MTSKIGRPRKAKGEQRVHFTTRFTRNDLAKFKRAAKRAKQELRPWVEVILTTAAKE